MNLHCWKSVALAGTIMVMGCGPELTTPASSNISGTWVSADTAAGVTDFKLDLAQGSNGAITGTWSGRGVVMNGACPVELGCAPSAGVVGSNTVFQILIDFLGAGPFSGQAEAEDRFRGHLAGSELVFQRMAVIQGANRSPGGDK